MRNYGRIQVRTKKTFCPPGSLGGTRQTYSRREGGKKGKASAKYKVESEKSTLGDIRGIERRNVGMKTY